MIKKELENKIKELEERIAKLEYHNIFTKDYIVLNNENNNTTAKPNINTLYNINS